MIDRLTRRSEQIGIFPYSGRAVPEFEVDSALTSHPLKNHQSPLTTSCLCKPERGATCTEDRDHLLPIGNG